MARPNGEGKTTAAYTLLPEVLNVWEFVNADEITRGLSPFKPDAAAFEAGRIMLQRIEHLMKQEVDFAFETTLSTRSYVQTIRRAQKMGYVVSLYYFWLPSAEVSKERVAMRVSRGGHNIPPDVIDRRYGRSMINLTKLYVPVCDCFAVFNNAGIVAETVATGGIDSETIVLKKDIWKTILNYESKSGETNS
ncbi:zeta toxin family protein [Spirosoma sp.]|uniref:zeta toxin family protein n=1 Tax=Spirosoma sp. TaxID=1899569 RepID=UPI002616CAD8|nr:zeta toxin family protein [Spirosoma sp.]MCX6218147.1 zeta toxin family protein [Spirosoma sp.]